MTHGVGNIRIITFVSEYQQTISSLFQSPDPPSQPEAAASTMEKNDSGKILLPLVSSHQMWSWVSKTYFTLRKSWHRSVSIVIRLQVLQFRV